MPTRLMNLLSEEQIAQISYGKQWTFHGGIHPQENKQQSKLNPIVDAGIPPFLVIPVEHRGHVPEILVKVGDPVLNGQALTKVYGAMVVQHASSSGVVIAIEKRADLHPSGLPVLSIVIETDGLDRSVVYKVNKDFHIQPVELLIEQIQHAGIVGMGGAGFPSHLKLSHPQNIKLLIINAAECEPYITADDRLMQEYAGEVILGINVLSHILQPEVVVLAIEDNKPEAIAALKLALNNTQQTLHTKLIIRVIPTRYPSGSEKQLIEIITGQQTPQGKHPTDLGIVMHNVGTAFAIKEAIVDGKPLTSRIVTLTGEAFQQKGNVSVRIGTPIQYLLDKYKLDNQHLQKLVIGGPMMGFTLSHGDIPVTKTCNCILAATHQEIPDPKPEMPCIRCGECAEVCPATLLPQQLLWYSKSQDHDKLAEYSLPACIECGACAFVCPSDIPLVKYYRIAKAEIRNAQQEAKKAEIARLRHENRATRLEQAKLERQAKHQQAAEKRKLQLKDKNAGQDLITAALERARARKQALAESTLDGASQTTNTDDKKSSVAAAIARAKAKKQAVAENGQAVSPPVSNDIEDPKKAAVAAAIARAKAKKQAVAENGQAVSSSANNDNEDPKKAAVAAAIARAKAKKQAAAENGQAVSSSANNDNEDPKKAAVAAAIVRAKAKKQAAAENGQAVSSSANNDNEDPKKAAVAAAIARAKAKKQAAAENGQVASSPVSNDIEDPKKTAVAAAIARAKAKKQASLSDDTLPDSPLSDSSLPDSTLPNNKEVIVARKLRKQQARLHKQQQLEQEHDSNSKNEAVIDHKNDLNNATSNDRKAKIAAAIAKAKARQAAQKDQ